MEIYLKRYFWVVPLAVVMMCGVLAASATNHVIEAKLVSGTEARPREATPGRSRAREPKPPPTKDVSAITSRNMFCSTCEPPKEEEPAAPTAPTDDNHPPITSLPLALVATFVLDDERASAATLVNTSTAKSGSYRIGDVIPDAGEIRRIKPKFVDFHNTSAGRVERVELGGTESGGRVASSPTAPPRNPTPPSTPSPAPAGTSPESELLSAVDKGVRRVSDTSYDIDRALVDKILLDPSVVARQARIVPSIRDGKANGFKMYAIRPNSVFAKIGLQNGDTIQSINGFDMSSPDKALEVYTKVRSASNLSISILRRGQPVQMEYSIR